MPHQCVKCGKVYDSAAKELLKGCECGSHYFFFFKNKNADLQEQTKELTQEARNEIIKDIQEVVGPEIDQPIILDIESVKVKEPGKFEIDLVSLFKRKPIIYKVEEGKYIIDIASTFQLKKKEKNI